MSFSFAVLGILISIISLVVVIRNNAEGRPGISVGCMRRSLFMRGKNMTDPIGIQIQFIINIQNRLRRKQKRRIFQTMF